MKNIFDHLSKSMQEEFFAALALKQSKHLTPRLLRTLLIHYGSAYEIFCQATKKQDLQNYQDKKHKIPIQICQELKSNIWRDMALQEWQLSKKIEGDVILWTDYRYPLGLKQIIDAPPFFYVRGDISLLSAHSIAIVGSRKFHQASLEQTKKIAKELSACGICVVSGMAKGIDYAAHRGALEEVGSTIAVLGSGINHIYPIENTKLYHEISERGLLISEFPLNSKPLSQNFPIRNRLVSGMSEAVLVAEAELRSGSLITARLALEQNRPVYVFAPLHENHSLGCQALIKDGAVKVNDALSIIADIAPNLEDKSSQKKGNIQQKVVYDLENGKVMSMENLSNTTNPYINTIQGQIGNQNTEQNTIENLKSKTLEYEIKPRPSFNENQPELEIDFGKMAQKLMGEIRPYKVQEVFSAKKIKKTNKKENSKVKIISKVKASDENINKEKIIKNTEVQKNKGREFTQLEENIMKILTENSALVPDEILVKLPNTQQNISEISMSLLMLEMENYLQRLEGNRYQKI